MATRVLAQVLAAGAAVLFRAAAQAWGQALQNAHKTGVAGEAVRGAAAKVSGQIQSAEAHMILGIKEGAPWGEVMKRYKHLFEVNEKHGSFYLTSKVVRAKEALEAEYEADGRKPPDEPNADGASNQPPQQIQEGGRKA